MKDLRIIEVKQSVFADNNADADRLRRQLKQQKTFLLNIMSSPGAGKTSLLRQVVPLLQEHLRSAVLRPDHVKAQRLDLPPHDGLQSEGRRRYQF